MLIWTLLLTFASLSSSDNEFQCWLEKPDTHFAGRGLTKSAGVNDALACQALCRSTPRCRVVDVDQNSNPKCWYDALGLAVGTMDLKHMRGCKNYMTDDECLGLIRGVDVKCWTSYPRTQYLGLVNVKTAQTFLECLRYCLGNPRCSVVDWDLTSKCWTQNNGPEVDLKKQKGNSRVFNFILDRRCLSAIDGLDLTQWEVNFGIHYAGQGLDLTNINSLRECLAVCLKSSKCGAVDWIPDKRQCWMQTKDFKVSKLDLRRRDGSVINFFRRFGRSTYLDGLDASCWNVKAGYMYLGLTTSPAKTLKDCVDACLRSPLCFLLTWHENKCYLKLDGNKGIVKEKFKQTSGATTLFMNVKGFSQYRKTLKLANFLPGWLLGGGSFGWQAGGLSIQYGGHVGGLQIGGKVGGLIGGLLGHFGFAGKVGQYGGKSEANNYGFGKLGCKGNKNCLNLIRLSGLSYHHWTPNWGLWYNGLKEKFAKTVRECAVHCSNDKLCFVFSWLGGKCYVQGNGSEGIKPGNLQLKAGALTFVGRQYYIKRKHKFGKLGLTWESSGSDDESELGFGQLTCKNDKNCLGLVQQSGLSLKFWRYRYGLWYRFLIEAIAKSVRGCAVLCSKSRLCYAFAWWNEKCYVQANGKAKVNAADLEQRNGALLFVARFKRLLKLRKFGKLGLRRESDGSDDSDDGSIGFKELTCKDKNCWKLVKQTGLPFLYWRHRYGLWYKGLKEYPGKSLRSCALLCSKSKLCNIFSWLDGKCYVQVTGETKVNTANLERKNGALTFIARFRRLLKLRKYGRLGPGGSGDSDDSQLTDEKIGLGDLRCRKNPNCEKLVKVVVKSSRRLYGYKYGVSYKGLSESKARDIKECLENCLFSRRCFVFTWLNGKCLVQSEGSSVRPENFQLTKDAITFVAKVKRLYRYRKYLRLFGPDGAPEEKDSKSDDGDEAAARLKFGELGCKNNPRCKGLIRRLRLYFRRWFVKFGKKLRGLKETPAKDIKECNDLCLSSDSCFAYSWWNEKCYLQENGDEDIKPTDLEDSNDAITLLARVRRLKKYRKLLKLRDDASTSEESSEDEGYGIGDTNCKGDQNCLELVKQTGLNRRIWKYRLGLWYKKLKLSPPKTIKDCASACSNSKLCYLFSWWKGQCHLQDNGDTKVNREDLEPKDGALTFIAKIRLLLRFRKYGRLVPGESSDSEDSQTDDDKLGLGDLSCKDDPKCENVVKLVTSRRNLWNHKYGVNRKGTKETPAKTPEECAEVCLRGGTCFSFSWWNDKCYVEENGDPNLKPGDLQPQPGALTFIARVRRLYKYRKYGRLLGPSKVPGDGEESKDSEDEEAEAKTKYGELGCRKNPKCTELVENAGISHKKWLVKYGKKVKGLKEKPAKDLKECNDLCLRSQSCFSFTWSNEKCYVDEGGNEDVKPGDLEDSQDAITVLARVSRVKKYRKLLKSPGLGEIPGEEVPGLEVPGAGEQPGDVELPGPEEEPSPGEPGLGLPGLGEVPSPGEEPGVEVPGEVEEPSEQPGGETGVGEVPTPGEQPGEQPGVGEPGFGEVPSPGEQPGLGVPGVGEVPSPGEQPGVGVPGVGEVPSPGEQPGVGEVPSPGEQPGVGVPGVRETPSPGVFVPGVGETPAPGEQPGVGVPGVLEIPSPGEQPGVGETQTPGEQPGVEEGPPGEMALPNKPGQGVQPPFGEGQVTMLILPPGGATERPGGEVLSGGVGGQPQFPPVAPTPGLEHAPAELASRRPSH